MQLQRKKEENITERLEFLYQKDLWRNFPVNLQLHNVDKVQRKKNVEDKFMFKSIKEKLHSEKHLWMHVTVEQNFQEDAKETFMQEVVPEDTTDVQEDVWEKHAAFVQNLNALPKTIQLLAKDQLLKHAEEFKESENLLTEDTEKLLLLEKLISAKEFWIDTATELQQENVEQILIAEQKSSLKSKKEKELSTKHQSMLVDANLTHWEDTDVKENVWEKLVLLVLDSSAKTKKEEEDAEDHVQEDAENFKSKEKK